MFKKFLVLSSALPWLLSSFLYAMPREDSPWTSHSPLLHKKESIFKERDGKGPSPRESRPPTPVFQKEYIDAQGVPWEAFVKNINFTEDDRVQNLDIRNYKVKKKNAISNVNEFLKDCVEPEKTPLIRRDALVMEGLTSLSTLMDLSDFYSQLTKRMHEVVEEKKEIFTNNLEAAFKLKSFDKNAADNSAEVNKQKFYASPEGLKDIISRTFESNLEEINALSNQLISLYEIVIPIILENSSTEER